MRLYLLSEDQVVYLENMAQIRFNSSTKVYSQYLIKPDLHYHVHYFYSTHRQVCAPAHYFREHYNVIANKAVLFLEKDLFKRSRAIAMRPLLMESLVKCTFVYENVTQKRSVVLEQAQ